MKEPYEYFKCCDCDHNYEDWVSAYESIMKCSTDNKVAWGTKKACPKFEPKYSVRDRYRICVLENKVEELIIEMNRFKGKCGDDAP